MQIGAYFGWWYTVGWFDQAKLGRERLRRLSDFFSIGLLVKNLFKPFKQLDTDRVKGSLDVVFRAWIDRMISRMIGAMIRTVLIFIGMISWIIAVIANLVWLVVWPTLPVFPVVGVFVTGVLL
ncbi:hypothetical protein EOL73_02450 [Candidatus Saccharibacteria bacterium]|nr:hypothetical protein [Candidatus Saccharibacteria bacterium]